MTEAPHGEKFRDAQIVTLLVSPDKVAYNVHESILCDASKVFKAAFYGEFKESSDRSMTLEDEDTDAVEDMIGWLYSAKIHLNKVVSLETANKGYSQLARLYILADKYDMVGLKNSIIDELYELRKPPADTFPPAMGVVTYVFANTTRASSFRKLLVAWYAWHIGFNWYGYSGTQSSLANVPDFAADLAVALATKIHHPNRQTPFALDRSQYYEKPT